MEFLGELLVEILYLDNLVPFRFWNMTADIMLLLYHGDIFVNNDQTLDKYISDIGPENIIIIRLDLFQYLFMNII